MTILTHEFKSTALLSLDSIASASYDTKEKELTVTFLTGRTYTYVNVPKETYDDLVASKSAGKYFATIKNTLVMK
jgi:hypothetical protein